MDLSEIKVDVSPDCTNNFDDFKSPAIKTNSDLKPLSKQTDLCNCPLHCSEKIPKEAQDYLFQQFNSLQRHSLQNKYLQKYIVIRSVAKRLWEDEIIDGKIQRRVTCKYQIPELSGVMTNKDLSDKSLQTDMEGNEDNIPNKEPLEENGFKSTQNEAMVQIKMDQNKSNNATNNYYDDPCDMSTDTSSSDSENEDFMNITLNSDDMKLITTSGNIEICQKAFINIYRITEKRIRYLRERLIMKSRYLAEKKQKKIEEMERTLSIARNLGAGCQPLIALLETTNSLHLSDQILAAIEKDIILVNNFFRHQLWKPEYISVNSKGIVENNRHDFMQLSLLERLEPVTPKLS